MLLCSQIFFALWVIITKDITDKEFYAIRDYIKDHYGINLGDEKKSLIYSRLRTTLIENGFENFTQYFEHLLKDKSGDAIVRFVDKITTNHTFFMREVDHFDYLRDHVLPYIEETYSAQKDLRIWCAACSSGEESNTLQMIAQDHFKGKGWDTQILATDISTQVLDKAVQSVYSADSVQTVPDKWKKTYFAKINEASYAVTDEIKKHITYRKFNLMQEKYVFKKKMQVIFCRNVMIYFDNKTRDEVVARMYEITEPGGYLFIGHSETLNHTNTKYKYVMPAVYRKT
ncbi:MAG: protein-glutamate O-methyltransferase CheR [Defluviitaleaceae bacterium]|nr:protein-glutamate O-methyltransferase CheR [Defluviitaleaceae bacterium]